MMHVKRWHLLSLACLVVEFVPPLSAVAGPTAAHVMPTGFPQTLINSESIESRLSRGQAPLAGDQFRTEPGPEAVFRSPSSTPGTLRPSVFAPRFFPFFWNGPSALGVFPYANCVNSGYAPGLIGPFTPNAAMPTGCFGATLMNGSSDTPAQLVPGKNKDALYGPEYNPNVNTLQ